jgi:hypothetical protein
VFKFHCAQISKGVLAGMVTHALCGCQFVRVGKLFSDTLRRIHPSTREAT